MPAGKMFFLSLRERTEVRGTVCTPLPSPRPLPKGEGDLQNKTYPDIFQLPSGWRQAVP